MSFIVLLLGICLADLMIKKIVEAKVPEGEVRPLFGGKLLLRNFHNNGIALGKWAGRTAEICKGTLLLLSALGLHFLCLLPRRGRSLQKTGEAMVLGGGLCNWFDRFHQGYVTDYLSFAGRCRRLGRIVFNLSDLFIFAGSLLMAAGVMKAGRPADRRGFCTKRVNKREK